MSRSRRIQENSTVEQPKIIGCIVCDLDGELRARDMIPGEKPLKSFYSEYERDIAITRLISGEAYREHEALKEELFAGRSIGTDIAQVISTNNQKQYYDDSYDYEEYLD